MSIGMCIIDVKTYKWVLTLRRTRFQERMIYYVQKGRGYYQAPYTKKDPEGPFLEGLRRD
jgi:hypothetical protein